MNKHIRIINGVELNNLYPDSFTVPSGFEKENLELGDYVKVGLEFINPPEDSPGAERMWFKLTNIGFDGTLIGELNNHPVVVSDYIEYGDNLIFKLDNVLSIHR